MSTMTVSVRSCQRCGADHVGMKFQPLSNPADRFRFWGSCPVTGQPVLLAVIETEEPVPTDEML